jgi:hypothetical protein
MREYKKSPTTRKDRVVGPSGWHQRARRIFYWQNKPPYFCFQCRKELDESMYIHHLDHDYTNNAIENLKPTCRSCHHRRQVHPMTKSSFSKRYGIMKKDLPVRISGLIRSRLQPWNEIEDKPNTVRLSEGVGYVRCSVWIDHLGFTLQQIGDFLGISRQRVHQLCRSNPKKVEETAKKMRKALASRSLM